MLLQSLRVINRSRPLVNRHARFPAFFDEKCLSSDHSQVIELRFSNGFFRFHCDREYVLSYFTPFGAVLNELADNDNAFRSIGNPSEDVKISVQKGTKNFKLANQNTLGS